MKAEDVIDMLARYQINALSEEGVQERIEMALHREKAAYRREVELAPGCTSRRSDASIAPGRRLPSRGTSASRTMGRTQP